MHIYGTLINNFCVILSSSTGMMGSAVGVAYLGEPNSPQLPGRFIVNFYKPVSKVILVDPNYNVIQTDYDNFSIVYECRPKDCEQKTEFLWVLTRQRQPSQPDLLDQLIHDTLKELGIDESRLKKIDQTNCEAAFVDQPKIN